MQREILQGFFKVAYFPGGDSGGDSGAGGGGMENVMM